MHIRLLLTIGTFGAIIPTLAPAAEPVAALADEIVAFQLEADPTLSYTSGLKAPTHARFADNSPAAIARNDALTDVFLQRLEAIDPSGLEGSDAVTHAVALEMLQANKGLRICRNELWGVNHMFGWHRLMPLTAERQPVATPQERAQALQRWGSLGRYVDVEIANLRKGLAEGYSAPRPVVERVIRQIEGSIVDDAAKSPFHSPAKRAEDAAFRTRFEKLIRDEIQPALRRYADFLKTDYLPQARETLGLSALPNGRECYAAWLRSFTTLDRTPEEVMALGEQTVAANVADVRAMGKERFGTDDFKAIVARVRDDPANRFASEAEILPFVLALVEKGKAASASVFQRMPDQPMEVRLYPEYMRGSGVTSHYEPGGDPNTAAHFMLQTDNWQALRRTDMEVLAYHEAYPGHHMQLGLAASLPTHDISKIASNSAYAEGWGRYAEALSEELGLYSGDPVKIQRRAWPARGMVADPGLHLKGWSREQAYQYLLEAGRFSPQETAELIDRMAALPGQLTAYDSGGLEVRALRREAETALGDRFDLKAFHRIVLENGAVPLLLLRRNVGAWIAATNKGSNGN